jgi:AAA domain
MQSLHRLSLGSGDPEQAVSANPEGALDIALRRLAQALVVRGIPQAEATARLREEAEKAKKELSDAAAKSLYDEAAIEMRPWMTRTLADALRGATEEPPWVIKGLVMEDSATLVSAQPHSIKSLSWLAGAMQAVAKKKVWDHFEAPNVEQALFIETEDPLWLVEGRVRGLATGLGVRDGDLNGFAYIRPGPFDLVGEEQTLRILFRRHSPDFVVLSTLQNLLGNRNYKEQADMAPVVATIIRLSQEAPIILLTHSPWNKKQRRAAGTVTLSANFATTVHYAKVENEGDTFAHLLLDSKAGSTEQDFYLKVGSDGDRNDPASVRTVAYGGKGWPKGTKTQAILQIAEDNPQATSKEIAEEVGCTDRHVRKVLGKEKEEQGK